MARGGEQYDQYDSWPPPRDYAMEKIQAFLAILPVLISPRRVKGDGNVGMGRLVMVMLMGRGRGL